jgi:cytochrome c2
MIRQIYIRTVCTAVLLAGLTSGILAADVSNGEKLFNVNCTACHHLEMRLVGPALKNVHQRHDSTWMFRFIRSSQSMIEAGDSTAVALFNTYNKVIMPDQNLTQDEISDILAYLRAASADEAGADDNPIPRPETVKSDIRPLKFTDYRFWIMYTIIVILVIVAINYKAELVALNKRVDPDEAERMSQAP